MNIALVGYGKMGKLLAARTREQGHRIVMVIDPSVDGDAAVPGAEFCKTVAGAGNLAGADVALEFTRPDTAAENITALAARKIPVVSGTTGWYSRLAEVVRVVEDAGAALLWSPNFSLGVNLFYHIAAFAAKMFDPFPDYDVGGFEAHHNKKADSPSGTAKTLMEQVLAAMTRKKNTLYETLSVAPPPDAIHFASIRAGSLPGTHTLFFDSPADTIEITHTARGRDGFAAGALRAAEWLVNASSSGKARVGVFTMNDVLADILA
ncbi:MAG: 4-hydroxy-tetrahydrodipicolinate reductase [Spirochaetaceae bacterium]|jgi:4-hydroxy-tetrahydrodipicolinate reductase|nr:4-hydroxy-tetrahydrodipicolinate reductase [Spirochaetaceae bacterium]